MLRDNKTFISKTFFDCYLATTNHMAYTVIYQYKDKH